MYIPVLPHLPLQQVSVCSKMDAKFSGGKLAKIDIQIHHRSNQTQITQANRTIIFHFGAWLLSHSGKVFVIDGFHHKPKLS